MTYDRNFEAGQKVKCIFGKIWTVREQNGCMVFVEELAAGHFHPSKLWAIA